MDIQIKLNHFQITELTLSVGTFNHDVTKELGTSFGFISGFNDEDKNSFAILFKLELKDPKSEFILKVRATAHFETNVEIDDRFKESSFIKISAPAIAFPYLRTFISNFTLNSGYEPIILPSFNFVKMVEDTDSHGEEK